MAQPVIIDRRKNTNKKNHSNRQRFLDRYRNVIKEAAKKHIGSRKITDSKDQEITVGNKGIDEPHFRHSRNDGIWDTILPGNDRYISGDTIEKEKGGGSGQGGKEAGVGATGDDEFQFILKYDEYLDLIFDDLELPDLIKASHAVIEEHKLRRSGHSTTGTPSNINIERTVKSGLTRRIALRKPKLSRIEELELLLKDDTLSEDTRIIYLEELEILKSKASKIAFLDDVDLRYNNFIPVPKPITKAVMFCVMDVSYSMGEREKIIAKKFFMLLHLFLKRAYERIDVVFIRHHETAEECDEEEFFTSKKSGGTKVSTAYQLLQTILKERYNTSEWNIYISNASDGDNYNSDNVEVIKYLNQILPDVQYMTYIEIPEDLSQYSGYDGYGYSNRAKTNLWETLEEVKETFNQIELDKINNESQVVKVFRKFFTKDRVKKT